MYVGYYFGTREFKLVLCAILATAVQPRAMAQPDRLSVLVAVYVCMCSILPCLFVDIASTGRPVCIILLLVAQLACPYAYRIVLLACMAFLFELTPPQIVVAYCRYSVHLVKYNIILSSVVWRHISRHIASQRPREHNLGCDKIINVKSQDMHRQYSMHHYKCIVHEATSYQLPT